MSDVKTTLIKTRDLLSPDGAWIRRSLAAKADGTLSPNWDAPDVVSFCIVGALWRVSDDNDEAHAAINYLEGMIDVPIVDWNNYVCKDQAELLSFLDSAISSVDWRTRSSTAKTAWVSDTVRLGTVCASASTTEQALLESDPPSSRSCSGSSSTTAKLAVRHDNV